MEHSGSGLSLIQVAMARYASGALLGFCPPPRHYKANLANLPQFIERFIYLYLIHLLHSTISFFLFIFLIIFL